MNTYLDSEIRLITKRELNNYNILYQNYLIKNAGELRINWEPSVMEGGNRQAITRLWGDFFGIVSGGGEAATEKRCWENGIRHSPLSCIRCRGSFKYFEFFAYYFRFKELSVYILCSLKASPN